MIQSTSNLQETRILEEADAAAEAAARQMETMIVDRSVEGATLPKPDIDEEAQCLLMQLL